MLQPNWLATFGFQEGKNSLKTEFLGRLLLEHQGPRRRDIPDPTLGCPGQRLYARRLFSVVLERKWPGCPRDLGRDVPVSEQPHARELWADFRSLGLAIFLEILLWLWDLLGIGPLQ